MSLLEFKKIEACVEAMDFSKMRADSIKKKIQSMFEVGTYNRHLLQPQIDRVINKYI